MCVHAEWKTACQTHLKKKQTTTTPNTKDDMRRPDLWEAAQKIEDEHTEFLCSTRIDLSFETLGCVHFCLEKA